MQKVKIEKIYRNSARRDGTPYVSKQGKPYEKVDVNDGQKWLSAFDRDGWTKDWAVGDTISVDVVVKESNGRTFHNIEKPKSGTTSAAVETHTLIKRIEALEEVVFPNGKEEDGDKVNSPEGTFDVDPNDLPF